MANGTLTHEPATAQEAAGLSLEDVLDRTTAERTDLLRVRMENAAIMSECRARPRSMVAIKAALADQLEAFPELAVDAIYQKPVGKDEGGRQKLVEGLSIRAAETIAECYGYNRVRCEVTLLDPAGDKVKVEASYTDYQNGRVWEDAGIVSRYYKGRDGKMNRSPDDRFFGVVVKAEASRRIREVILRSVNAGLKAWFENECRRIQSKLLDEDALKKILKAFDSIGVALEQLEALLDRPKAMGWTVREYQVLQGVWVAIRDGETSKEEVFGEKPKPQSEPPKPNGGGVTVGDLTGGNGQKPQTTPAPDTKPADKPADKPAQTMEADPEQAQREADALCMEYQELLNQAAEEVDLQRHRNGYTEAFRGGRLGETHYKALEASHKTRLKSLQKPPRR
jgi:hypothetical protein